MKHAYSFAGICLALTLAACGGSHSSTAASTSTSSGNPANVRIEAALVASTTPYYSGQPASPGGVYYPPADQVGPASCPVVFDLIDPNNIEAGDTWQFELVSYSNANFTGTRTVLKTVGWTSSDTASLYGSLAYDSGIFSATGAQTQTPQSVSVNYNGQNYFTTYSVLPHQARVRGQLLDASTRAPIPGVEVDFYGPSAPGSTALVIRGKVITQSDGTFQASVPAQITTGTGTFNPTTNMQINNSSLPAGYDIARTYTYNGTTYSTGVVTSTGAPPLEIGGTSQTLSLVTGNNDLLAVTQCSYSGIEASNGWLLLQPNQSGS